MFEKLNRQHAMIANPKNRKLFIHNINKYWFPTTMLALWLYMICSLNMIYPEVLANI